MVVQKRGTRQLTRGRSVNVKGLTLEREIVGYPSVSLSSTLSKNEKVEHHIRMKTHKLTVLRYWVKSGVNPLCVG